MKHPVTTTLTIEELEKLKKAKGSSSMLRFIHDAIVEKCEECSKDERKEVERHSERGTEQPEDRDRESEEDASEPSIINDID